MRNGSGGYSLPSNSWNPALNGAPATAADWQALINDVAAAIQQSISADGQTTITGNLQMGGNKLTNLAAGSAAGNSVRFEQLFGQGALTDIASASITDIGAPLTNFLRVTGTTGITSFGTNYNGPKFLIFSGVVTLTNSATLVLPSGGDITTAAGDSMIVIPLAAGWQVVAFQRASGQNAGDIVFIPSGSGSVPSTVEKELRRKVYVDNYGADPTGATDSTDAFNRAMAALPANGGNLYMGAGKYLVSTLDMPNDPKVINLIGAGKTATTLKMATPQGPIIRKVPTFGRITGALMSDFTIEAHAASDKTNLTHRAMVLSGFNNSFFKRIRYKSNGINPGDGSVGVVFDIASHPYLTYQLVFEGIDCSINHGPSRVFLLNNNGQTVLQNPNIIEVRDSWFYALGGCNAIIDGANCTKLKVTGNIFEDCPGATGVVLGQATTVDNNWFELLGTNISTNSTASTDGGGSVVLNNYFSGAGTSFIDTISVKPLWIGNAGGGQTITGQGVFKLEAQGATPAIPTLSGGDGALSLIAANTRFDLDITGRVTYLLRYTNTPATAVPKKFTVSAIAGFSIESIDIGVIRGANGDPKACGIDAAAGSYWVAYTSTDAHEHNVIVTFKKL